MIGESISSHGVRWLQTLKLSGVTVQVMDWFAGWFAGGRATGHALKSDGGSLNFKLIPNRHDFIHAGR